MYLDEDASFISKLGNESASEVELLFRCEVMATAPINLTSGVEMNGMKRNS